VAQYRVTVIEERQVERCRIFTADSPREARDQAVRDDPKAWDTSEVIVDDWHIGRIEWCGASNGCPLCDAPLTAGDRSVGECGHCHGVLPVECCAQRGV
jgi:hypothetical protein